MTLPNYKVINDSESKSEIYQRIIFDKIWVRIYGDAKTSRTEIKYNINPGCRRRNVDLSIYMKAINDYLISHPFYRKYKNKVVNLSDFNCIKFLDFVGLKINSDEFQIINNKYPNIISVNTKKCTIYKEVSIGCLKCNYYDYLSDIMSLDSFDGFSGKTLFLDQTHIVNMNKNVLHLNNICSKFKGLNIDYERFFLTTSAPNLRKIEIYQKRILNDKDLLFISGFYNLESVQIGAILSSYKQLEKLEKLREIRNIFCSNENELEKTRKKREEIYQEILATNASESCLKDYLMTQRMAIQNQFQEFQHKLYVPRLERVKWENKISIQGLEEIKKDLIVIYNMSRKQRQNIFREKRKYTVFDSLYGLDFDKTSVDDEEYTLVDSRLFESGGIKYYVKRRRLILDEPFSQE